VAQNIFLTFSHLLEILGLQAAYLDTYLEQEIVGSVFINGMLMP
jgi:hypothetical protein